MSLKFVTIVGARPQFVKAAVLSRELTASGVTEIMIHTGQHYDALMSDVFFRELDIPCPHHYLNLGGGSHGQMTGRMLEKIESILIAEKPAAVIVYGDTNSTLAGALAASKLHIPVIHVEAGLRSFNRKMPEEINRILTDHMSTMLFCPTRHSKQLLETEGIKLGVHVIGDLMRQALDHALNKNSLLLDKISNEVAGQAYAVLTCHRAENTDDRDRLMGILEGVSSIGMPVIWPVHPRTERAMAEFGIADTIANGGPIKKIPPLGYVDMAHLMAQSSLILTDSGGLQKEAYWLEIPCVTLRSETEWVETVKSGWNQLTGSDSAKIVAAASRPKPERRDPDLFGTQDAGARAVQIIRDYFS